VLIADARSVIGYDLFSGRELFHFTLRDAGRDAGPQGSRVREGRYTLTAWNNRVFARLGPQTFGPAAEERDAAVSTIVCLNLAGTQPGELVWQVAAVKPDDSSAVFEGAPLAAQGRVYSALSWLVGQRTHTAVACFDAQTGQRRWGQEVCETPEFESTAEPRRRQHLLTLAGGRLYYCSHSGAVVALDPWSGQCLWASRYVGRGPKTQSAGGRRELAPCVYADGRIYVGPHDTSRLLCLDAASGGLVWERPNLDVTQLLGVSRGRVYFTTPRGLQCVMADTGLSQGAWLQPAEGSLPGLGRGLLAGSWLLWPTQDPKLPLRGVTLAEGIQERFDTDGVGKAPRQAEPEYLEPTMLRAILPGNMAFGNDCLVVAGLDELAAYVPQKKLLKTREQELKRVQEDANKPMPWRAGSVSDRISATNALPLATYRLAMAQTDAGLTADAEKNLERLSHFAKGLPNEADWKGLAQERVAELRGEDRGGWRVMRGGWRLGGSPKRVALGQKSFDPSPPAPPSVLELPLERWLDVPASQSQALSYPAAPHQALLLGQRGDEIFCLDTLTGATRWSRSVLEAPFASRETLCLASLGNVALRVDPERFVGLKLAEGNAGTLWARPAPLRPTVSYCLDGNEPKRLSNPFRGELFRCNSRLLYFMVDQRSLVALDPVSGEFVWHVWAPGGSIRPLTGGRFSAHYTVGDRFLLVQAAGKWQLLDSATGERVHEGPAPTAWLQAPLALDDRRFVLCEEAGKVSLLDAATGLLCWTHEPARYTSLTGAPAQVFGTGQRLLVLVPRNIGPELVCLDPDKGTPRWAVPLLADDFDPQTAAVDREAVFFVARNTLQARSLRDGALQWKQTLPGGFSAWQVVRAGEALLVYPNERVRLPWLPLGANPWELPLLYHDSARLAQDRAILVIDPRGGQWIERLPLPKGQGPITLRLLPKGLAVDAGGRLLVFRPLLSSF
jgi:outer membrane protein assembly factor BamB